MEKLRRSLKEIGPYSKFVCYHGRVAHEEVNRFYRRADGFVFASTCETFGQVLTEAMQSGLPIACSNRSAAPEVVQDAGLYFNPERPNEIAEAMHALMINDQTRTEKAAAGTRRAGQFTWERCARDTFSFIRCVVEDEKNVQS